MNKPPGFIPMVSAQHHHSQSSLSPPCSTWISSLKPTVSAANKADVVWPQTEPGSGLFGAIPD